MIIDGLQCGHFDRAAFESLQKAGVGGVVVTCGFWEGALESLDSLGEWRAVGFNQEEIDKITHKNWLRLYETTFAKS